MGNATSSSKPPDLIKGRRRQITKDQLRAKSFLRRERAAVPTESTPLLESFSETREEEELAANGVVEENQQQQQYIEKLEADIQTLATKCAALESQNILVAVQQLDLMARYFSLAISIGVLYVYFRVTMWLLPIVMQGYLPIILNQIQDLQTCEDSCHALLGGVAKLLQNIWMMRILQLLLLVLPYFYNRATHGSVHRRFQVFVVAFIVILRIRMCRWREQIFLQEDTTHIPRFGESCTNDGIWEANYEISARFLYLSILRLKGLWTKTAQYLSSRADFVPVAYIRELSKLQDQAPVTPWEEVEKLLPPALVKNLTDFEQEPMASASIGQVHVARLGDQKVVVKVQHPHARTLMMDDFWSLKVLTKIIGWLEPDYAFMEILMHEWALEAVKELDFTYEAEHLREASRAIQTLIPTKDTVVYSNVAKTPFQVQVPEPMEQWSNRDVLVMNFCDGCRIDDLAQIEQWGLSRAAVMDGVAQAFAHFMYCSTIFNGDPHAGNLLVRPGIHSDATKGFTIVVLDWGLAKRLPEQKRVGFCQMVYAAATVDYGLLLDSYKTVGLKMKREDAGQSMEDMRFFLRDMAPRDVARKRIKSKIKQNEAKVKKTNEKVPMESKAYPGEFFFFIRVNELLHGLGSRFSVNLGYLDALCPYAEKGLRMSSFYDLPRELALQPNTPTDGMDMLLAERVQSVLKELEQEGKLSGGQVCVIDKNGQIQVDVVEGSLGGLRSHIPMRRDALILGYSTTKAVTATLAHLMVQEGYLSYDEPICERVWKQFCPYPDPPIHLHRSLKYSHEEVERRWKWKREITLRHILNHSAGFWSALPATLTIQKMASCEQCMSSFGYNPDAPEETLLPNHRPSDGVQMYHFMSFGWLVAGTLCGAYEAKHAQKNVTFQQVYQALLEPKLSERTKSLGFQPLGGSGTHILAQTVTADIRASQLIQRQREMEMENEAQERAGSEVKTMIEMFQGKEFLIDPRIWNSQDAVNANVPAGGGRFSAIGLASFYHDLSSGKLLDKDFMDKVVCSGKTALTTSTSIAGLQGLTRLTDDAGSGDARHTKMTMGYQLIKTDRDAGSTMEDAFSGLGHAGVGGSLGFFHQPTGISMAVMLNKADGGQDVTLRILRVIGDYYHI